MLIAKVNGKSITAEQLACEKVFIGLRCKHLTAEEMQKKALKNLIDAELVAQAARKQGIGVEEDEIDEAFIDLTASISDEETYLARLAELNLTEAEIRIQLEKHVLVEKYLFHQFSCEEDEDCEEKLLIFFEDNRDLFISENRAHVSHILISLQAPGALEKAQEIRAKIKTELDFAEQVLSNSCCPSILKNGDLGYVKHRQLLPELDEAIFGLKPGEISDIIRSCYGYHIFYLQDFEPGRELEFEEVKHLLKGYRKKLYFEINSEKHYLELRRQAEIIIY